MQLRRFSILAVAIAATLLSTLSFGQATPPVGDVLTLQQLPHYELWFVHILVRAKGLHYLRQLHQVQPRDTAGRSKRKQGHAAPVREPGRGQRQLRRLPAQYQLG